MTMAATTDQTYLQLHRTYVHAMRAYENALRDRRTLRNYLAVRRKPIIEALQSSARASPSGRPGWQAGTGGGSGTRGAPGRPPTVTARVYLGPDLGWALVGSTEAPTALSDTFAGFDMDKLYGRMSLELFWRRKREYREARAALLDHVRRKAPGHDGRPPEDMASDDVREMKLGEREWMGSLLADVGREVEAACRSTWWMYQHASGLGSHGLRILLLEGVSDAEFFDHESPTLTAMKKEVGRLQKAGQLGLSRY